MSRKSFKRVSKNIIKSRRRSCSRIKRIGRSRMKSCGSRRKSSIKNKNILDRKNEELPIFILFSNVFQDVHYYYDLIFQHTIYFFLKDASNTAIGKFANQLFIPDNNDISRIHFKQRTILGFLTISGNSNNLFTLLNSFKEINDCVDNVNIPFLYREKFEKDMTKVKSILQNIELTEDIDSENIELKYLVELLETNMYYKKIFYIIKQFVNMILRENKTELFKLYKKYFCLDPHTVKFNHITGIRCKSKKINEDIIYIELIFKLSNFIYIYSCMNDKNVGIRIIIHYILHLLKSSQSIDYNVQLQLNDREIYSSYITDLFYKFTNKDLVFQILPFLPNFSYQTKQFSTCGETTILNVINYCIINKDGAFNTEKINNIEVKEFYTNFKTITKIFQDPGITMTKWLDIVSQFDKKDIYNPAGDIHNNIKNILYVFNQLIKPEINFIYLEDALVYISNKELDISVESTVNTIRMKIGDRFLVSFVPGHGSMENCKSISIVSCDITKIKLYAIDNDIRNGKPLSIIYSLFNHIFDIMHENIVDYNIAKSKVVLTLLEFGAYTNNIIKIFLEKTSVLSCEKHIINNGWDRRRDIFGSIGKSELNRICKILINLKELSLINFDILDIQYVKNLKKLEILNLKYNRIKKINSIRGLILLQKINFNNNQIKDISPLETLSNLTELCLNDNNVTDISVLKKMSNLKVVHFDSNNLTDISHFSNLIYIEELSLCNNKISDIRSLKEMLNLERLYLEENIISNIEPIQHLILLNILHLNMNKIEDIKPLGNLKQLLRLRLADNIIRDIKPLENLFGLEDLNLARNKIRDIKPLENLFGLEDLVLSYNQITNIEVLKNMFKLRYLNLQNNKIEDILPLKNIQNLYTIKLEDNNIHQPVLLTKVASSTFVQNLYMNDIKIQFIT